MPNQFTRRPILSVWLFIILMATTGQTILAQSSITLDLLGQVVIPYHYSFKQTPVGGLSGLTYDERSGRFLVISDDRSQGAPARFYEISVQLNGQQKLTRKGIQFQHVHLLKTSNEKTYAKGAIDPEGIAIGPDQFVYVSSEGDPNKDIDPFIKGYSKAGDFARALTVPPYFMRSSSDKHEGIRTNLAFESLTTSPDKKTLYAATENALLQDGPAADSSHKSPARIMVYDLPSGNIIHEYRYDVAPVPSNGSQNDGLAMNGLSDLLALDNNGNLLALERSYVKGEGNTINLYQISTRQATDIKSVEKLSTRAPITPVNKQLVANLNDLGIKIDNYEGLALGPELPGGGRLLLMISDNNFSSSQQTIFTAFAIHM